MYRHLSVPRNQEPSVSLIGIRLSLFSQRPSSLLHLVRRSCMAPIPITPPINKMLAHLAQPIALAINQETLTRHKHRIPMDIARAFQPGDDCVQKLLDLLVCTARTEFRDPNGAAGGDFARAVDVALEVLGVFGVVVPVGLRLVRCGGGRGKGYTRGKRREGVGNNGGEGDVPVDADKVDVAVRASAHEVAEPVESHTIAAVGDCGRSEIHLVLDLFGGFHVFFPSICGLLRGHTRPTGAVSGMLLAGLSQGDTFNGRRDSLAHIRLIEPQQMRRAILDHTRRILVRILPDARMLILISPKHRYIFESRVGVIRGRAPVVAPAHLVVFDVEEANECGVVVGDAAATTTGLLRRGGGLVDGEGGGDGQESEARDQKEVQKVHDGLEGVVIAKRWN